MTTIEVIGPAQINVIGGNIVTVTYPAGADTVLSVQPDGSIATRPHGTADAYERALCKGDRLVYNPTGPTGRTFVLPFAAEVPNT